MARVSMGQTLKAFGLSLCVLGSFYLVFLTDFPRNWVPEYDVGASVTLESSGNRYHKHFHKHNHGPRQPMERVKIDQPLVRNIAKNDAERPESFPKSSITLTTSIVSYTDEHSIDKAYNSDGFFWGRYPKRGDYIEIIFNKPKRLLRIVIPSGNKEHKNDALFNSDLSISTDPYEGRCSNYKQVASFYDKKTVEHQFTEKKLIQCVRLTLSSIRKVKNDVDGDPYWLIISGITLT